MSPRFARSARAEKAAAGLLIAHVLVALAIVVWHPAHAEGDDVARFVVVATRDGTPYRDFPVEYSPMETILIDAAYDTGSISRAVGRTAIISLACDLGIYLVLRRSWGANVGLTYLAVSLPLQVFMPFRLDFVPVLLVTAAFANARSGRERIGGALFAASILFKFWPIVLLPVLLRNRQMRALVWSIGLSGLGLIAWWLSVGSDALRYVVTFRGARGWHVESTVGAVLSVLRMPMRIELGAVRVGTIPGWAPVILGVATLATLVLVWRKSASERVVPEGFPALAAVASLIVLSRVSSPQYVAWLMPWAAIALVERRRPVLRTVVGAVGLLAAAVFLEYWGIVGGQFELAWLAFARALALISIPILWLAVTEAPSHPPAAVEETADVPSSRIDPVSNT